MPEYPLVPDPRSDIVAGSPDFMTYLGKMPELYLRPEVPDIVKEHIGIAQRILEHSYFVYEFIDVAFTQVIIGLEKALRIKYKNTTNLSEEKKNFNDLLEWAHDLNFFEIADKEILDNYRKLRNGKVHHPKNTLGGILYLQRILEPIGLINDLYEDVQLRVERKNIWENLLKDVADVFKGGATLTFGDNTFFVRNILVAFVNNKRSSAKYYLSMLILTDPKAHSARQMLATENIVALNFTLDQAEKKMTGTDVNTNRTFTIAALDDLGLAALKHWENQINDIHYREDGEHAMPIETLAAFAVQARAEELHTKAIFDFYRGL